MNPDYLPILKGASHETLAQWWCDLNRYYWPDEFGKRNEADFVSVMHFISDTISLKECLREWNKRTLPGKEFDRWWRKNHATRLPV